MAKYHYLSQACFARSLFVSQLYIFNTEPAADSCENHLFIDDHSLGKIFSFVSTWRPISATLVGEGVVWRNWEVG